MIAAVAKAIDQLARDKDLRAVLLKSLVLALLVYVVLAALLFWVVGFIPETGWGWLDGLIANAAFFVLIVVMALFFPALVTLFVGVFLDDAARAVERFHYGADPPGREPDLWPSLMSTLKFTGVIIFLNLLILPVHILVIFFPLLNLFILYGLNGYLFGREYFELVARRHLAEADVKAMRRKYRSRVWLTGAGIAFALTIPIVNLATPVVATAAMVHIFKRLAAKSGAGPATAAP